MQITQITLIFYVQVPLTYVSSVVLTFFLHFVCLFFFVIFFFFQGKFWGISS